MECVTGKWPGPRPKHRDYIYTGRRRARLPRAGPGGGTTFGNTMMVPVDALIVQPSVGPESASASLPASSIPLVCASRENANKSLPGQPGRPKAERSVHRDKN